MTETFSQVCFTPHISIYDVIRLQKSALGYALLVKRRDWDRIQTGLNSLTPERIQTAITAFSGHQDFEDSAVKTLLRHLCSVGSYEPHSFGDKLSRRAEMKGLLIYEGMTAIWVTINPSELRNPLVLQLAGVTFESGLLPAAAAAV